MLLKCSQGLHIMNETTNEPYFHLFLFLFDFKDIVKYHAYMVNNYKYFYYCVKYSTIYSMQMDSYITKNLMYF